MALVVRGNAVKSSVHVPNVQYNTLSMATFTVS